MRRLAVRLIVSTALTVTVVAAIAFAATVTSKSDPPVDQLSAPKISPAGPLISATKLKAGDHAIKDFTVENGNGQAARLMLSGMQSGGNPELYDVLYATIRSKQTGHRWDGPLWQLSQARDIGTWDAGQTQDLTFDMEIPAWAGNFYQSMRAEYSLDFSFANDSQGADHQEPISKILTKKPAKTLVARKRNWLIRGTASDDRSAIAQVKMTLIRIVKKGTKGTLPRRCSTWVPKRHKMISIARSGCKFNWFSAVGKEKWNYFLPTKTLPNGTYILMSRAIDTAGNIESQFSPARGNSASFKIKR